MTIIFFQVNGDTFILKKITYDSTTESFDVTTESVKTGKQTIFKCHRRSKHYSFVEGLYKNPPPTEKKQPETNHLNGYKNQMTPMFLEILNNSYLLEHLTYNSETNVFTVLTERVGDWKKVSFKCPEESEHYYFIKSLYFNPPRENIKSINQIFKT